MTRHFPAARAESNFPGPLALWVETSRDRGNKWSGFSINWKGSLP